MGIAFNPTNILHGNNAEVWFGGNKLAAAESLQAKLTIDNEDIEVLGNPGTYSRYNGYAGTGTLKRYKLDSSFLLVMAKYVKTGVKPDLTIIASVKQPSTGKRERISLKDVNFSEATLIDLEKKKLLEEEIPFTFGSFKVLESIK